MAKRASKYLADVSMSAPDTSNRHREEPPGRRSSRKMASGYAVAGQASEIPRLDGDGFVHSSMDAPGGGRARE